MSVITVKQMIEWIELNITEELSLEEMAKCVGYSPYYCSAKFHECLGITFKQYVSRRRLELAAKEIAETKERCIDIAVKFGFSSQEAFTRAFTKAYGCPPLKYRKHIAV